MFEEVGTTVGILIIMLYLAVLMDGFAIFRIMVKQNASAMEYASVGLRWPKIIMVYIFGGVMLFYSIAADNSVYIMVIEMILSLLLFADAILSTIIKRKYGKK